MPSQLYQRALRWLKVLLPLGALILLSTLFIFARSITPPDPATVTEVNLTELAQNNNLNGPSFASVTRDGDALVIEAESAEPDKNNYRIINIRNLRAGITRPSGRQLQMMASQARLDLSKRQLHLGGGVRAITASGYRIYTHTLNMMVDQIKAQAAGNITATGPIGSLSAQKMVIKGEKKKKGTEVLFTGDVKLLYKPKISGGHIE